MSIYANFKPTRLYIKQHTVTGMLYFGKTIYDDIESYKGSGKYWTNHIKKHGTEYVENLWVSDWFVDPHDIEEFALFFSKEHNITESSSWANLKEENGLMSGGAISKESKIKSSITHSSTEYKERLSTTCVHCGKTISKPVYNRCHGDNCKENPNRTSESILKETTHCLNMRKTKNSKLFKQQNSITCEHCNENMFIGHYLNHHGEHCKHNPNRTSESINLKEEIKEKQRLAKTNIDYIKENTKICPYCMKAVKNPGTYAQMHGTNCKENPNRPQEAIDFENEFRKKISESRKTQEYLDKHTNTCIHCGKTIVGNPTNFHRHHNDNCKLNPSYTPKEKVKHKCSCGKEFSFKKTYEKHSSSCSLNS